MSDVTTGNNRRIARATQAAAIAFLVAMVSGIALVVVYFVGGGTTLQGILWALAFGGIAVGLGIWGKVLLDEPDVVEERPSMRSPADDRQRFAAVYDDATADTDPWDAGRRRFLGRLLAGAGASIGLALLLPFRSLGPGPGRDLFRTQWEDGLRLVSYQGEPIRPDELRTGSVATVFPDEHVGDADSQALLIAVEPGLLELDPSAPPTVDGLVCYSKICTHAGCPVGLYRSSVHELLCPCHQSKFDVLEGAQPISGPTTRPLPQLPLGVDDEGYLIALGDFEAPVGPAFWNMERGGGDDA
ncbi:MAG: Rieske 2Fe-2S domain-containing protein [Actinobacteria bacterium]|nr:Rieske 2Fe-2S domain-containing protein [Actinomycetota bacterium]